MRILIWTLLAARRQRLGNVERARVTDPGYDKYQREARRRGDAADVEQQQFMTCDVDRRPVGDEGRPGGEQDPQLGRTDPGKCQAKNADAVRRQVRFRRNQEIRGCERQRDSRVHQTRCGHAGDERGRPRQVDHVIDVIPVPWTRLTTHAGECPVEAVAEPVHGERCGNQRGAPRRAGNRGKRKAGRRHRQQAE
jgi:hypothetical protein